MAVLLALAGLWLERICRLPDDQAPSASDEEESV